MCNLTYFLTDLTAAITSKQPGMSVHSEMVQSKDLTAEVSEPEVFSRLKRGQLSSQCMNVYRFLVIKCNHFNENPASVL